LCLITALTYLDRLNMGIAGKYIQDEYGISTATMGSILSAFVFGYAFFQIPGGWAGDRFGPRGVLTFAIAWWSLFTAATALAPSLPLVHWFGVVTAFVIMRFLIGVGEAAALPNSNKIVAYWLGDHRRGIGNSIFLTGVGLGGASAPMLIAWIMQRWGWRTSFLVCGAMGGVMALGWHLYSTSRPEDHPRVNQAELALIRSGGAPPRARPGTPWRLFLTSRTVWLLLASYFCEGYANYIFYSWFFLYLINGRRMSIRQGGFWGAIPFLAVLVLAPLGGLFSDYAVRCFGRGRGRQVTVWLGMTLSALLMAGGAHLESNTLAVLCLAGAVGFNIFATSSWWAGCIDLSPDYSGSLSSMMNALGNLGGAFSSFLTGYFAVWLGWSGALDIAAAITFVASVLWCFINVERPLAEQNAMPIGGAPG
jgi:MFS transporter, ACS family, glucarate transporter